MRKSRALSPLRARPPPARLYGRRATNHPKAILFHPSLSASQPTASRSRSESHSHSHSQSESVNQSASFCEWNKFHGHSFFFLRLPRSLTTSRGPKRANTRPLIVVLVVWWACHKHCHCFSFNSNLSANSNFYFCFSRTNRLAPRIERRRRRRVALVAFCRASRLGRLAMAGWLAKKGTQFRSARTRAALAGRQTRMACRWAAAALTSCGLADNDYHRRPEASSGARVDSEDEKWRTKREKGKRKKESPLLVATQSSRGVSHVVVFLLSSLWPMDKLPSVPSQSCAGRVARLTVCLAGARRRLASAGGTS